MNVAEPIDKILKHIQNNMRKNDIKIVYLTFLISKPNSVPVTADSNKFKYNNPKLLCYILEAKKLSGINIKQLIIINI